MSLVQKNRRRAKAIERALAKRLGGRRVGILGQEDIFTDLFSVEVKSRKSVAVWDWYQQAVRNAKGKIPLLIVHITGKRHDDDLVVLSLADFEKLIKKEVNKNEQT
jgi:hypothetical protein